MALNVFLAFHKIEKTVFDARNAIFQEAPLNKLFSRVSNIFRSQDDFSSLMHGLDKKTVIFWPAGLEENGIDTYDSRMKGRNPSNLRCYLTPCITDLQDGDTCV